MEKPMFEISPNDLEEVKELAGWASIVNDLSLCKKTLNALLALMRNPETDHNTCIRDLWISALITYVRCFSQVGKRGLKLSPEIYVNLSGDPIGTHQYYKDIRDKHIAHPVSAFEEIQVGVYFSDDLEVTGIGYLSAIRVCDSIEGVDQLSRLADFAYRYALDKYKALESEVFVKVKKFSKEKLVSLKPVRITPQGGADVAKNSRK